MGILDVTAFTLPGDTGAQTPQGYADIIKNYLNQWGLGSLADTVDGLGRSGAGSDQINLTLQQTPQWKQRFSANATRIAAGLQALDPATYIGLEGQYKQVMAQYGLPKGFYDDQASLDNWIGQDISPAEISARAKEASDAYLTAPQSARDAWDQFYGTTGAGGAIASILDTSVAEPLIQQRVQAAAIGGAAIQAGVGADQGIATQAAQQGVTLDQARKAYQDVASRAAVNTAASNRFGGQPLGTGLTPSFGVTQDTEATLLGDVTQTRAQGTLYAEEKAQFASHGGASDASGSPGSNY